MNHTALIYLDIETGPNPVKPDYPPFKVSNGATKPETIQKQKDEYELIKEELRDAVWRKQSLDPLRGTIICLSFAIDDGEVVSLVGEEKDILMKFEDVVRDVPYGEFICFNGKRFDFVWLFYRAVKYGLKVLRDILPHTRNANNVTDVMELFSATSYGSDSWVSLDSLAKFLGLPCKESQGSEIHDMYLKGEIDKIVEHCELDVKLVRDIYNLTK